MKRRAHQYFSRHLDSPEKRRSRGGHFGRRPIGEHFLNTALLYASPITSHS